MAIPDYQEIMLPLLELTADGEIHTLRGVKDTLADRLSLSTDEAAEMLPSGQQSKFHNRIGWAKTYLKRGRVTDTDAAGTFSNQPARPGCAAVQPGTNRQRVPRPVPGLSGISRSFHCGR